MLRDVFIKITHTNQINRPLWVPQGNTLCKYQLQNNTRDKISSESLLQVEALSSASRYILKQ